MNAFFKITECKPTESKLFEMTKNLEKFKPNVSELDKPIVNDIKEKLEKKLEGTIKDYYDDLKNKSEVKETLSDKPNFGISDLEKISPEENAKMRHEFQELKEQLKKEWEEKYGMEWPKYNEDVYSENGKLIRKAGSDYDMHHIQPLGLGGKNTVENTTPLNAEVHYDKKGVHSPESPYNTLEKNVGGM